MTPRQIKARVRKAESAWQQQARTFRRRFNYLDQEPNSAYTKQRLRQLRNQIKFRKMVLRYINQTAGIKLLLYPLVAA